ncbi:MAG: hypothetical protein M1822_002141 [Bathelium mastoideum]|nr:MAG: hypothetical protein M1822_002141 [Bathelium mastoideum]
MTQKASVVSHEPIKSRVYRHAFGISPKYQRIHEDLLPELQATTTEHLAKDAGIQQMLHVTLANIRRNLPNLVSFVDSMVDHPLLKNFVSHCANPSLFGTALLENYPDLYDWLWAFDAGFRLLATGAPRFIPIPTLTRAQIARSRLLAALTAFHRALDAYEASESDQQQNQQQPQPSSDAPGWWRDLGDVSPLVRARADIYRTHGFPHTGRASADLALLWAMNANANPLVFWLALRIFASASSFCGDHELGATETTTTTKGEQDLLSRLRDEIAPHARATQPPPGTFAIPEPPTLTIDVSGLVNQCALLRACYIESLRVDSAPWALKKVLADFEIVESVEDAGGTGKPERYRLRKGEFADVAFDLHFKDPRVWERAETWWPERHLKGDEGAMPELGTVRGFGGGRAICKGRVFAEREVLAFIAGIIALWEMEPVGDKGWKIPRHGQATAVSVPKDDVRVKIRRRDLSAQKT